VALNACGAGGLSSGDKQACDAAAAQDGLTLDQVYTNGNISNSDIQHQASLHNSSNDDYKYFAAIVKICKQDGYIPATPAP
jgi:hypothetical protein